MSIYYSGGDATLPISETLYISGTTTRALTLNARAYGVGTATAQYTNGVLSPCPDPQPGCSTCASYTGCMHTEIPTCDGSMVVTCLQTTTTSTTSSLTTTSTTKTATSTTTTEYRLDVPVTGTIQLTFDAGVDPCAANTTAV
eukprot:CAMPEP_0198556164 /NCGR_PEP_ID=MMETSP1462-20131121/86281_1 /TAXON_ID=1333877 /ORGANISM="Brandtodinium nutriculum, Strain RCC3387" /LENGTH=141 /DNA_ID=CAMNT_0044286907 /DNA_START=20 /DNA_END=441 /DNA_ORIENTATION=-